MRVVVLFNVICLSNVCSQCHYCFQWTILDLVLTGRTRGKGSPRPPRTITAHEGKRE